VETRDHEKKRDKIYKAMKNKIFIFSFIIIGLVLILTNSCKKKETTDPLVTGPVPIIETTIVTNVTGSGATSGGAIASDNGYTITSRGVCWSTGTNPTIADSKTSDGAGAGYFISTVTGLSHNTIYYLRAYATNANGTGYGSTMSFTTGDIALGDNYGGGIVVYIFQAGEPGYVAGQKHGLILAPTDQSTGIQWYNGTNADISTSEDIGSGNANTNAIITSQGAGSYAAKLCADLVLGGFSDWYLPSTDELYHAYPVWQPAYNTFYWTSSQYTSTKAYVIYYQGGVGYLEKSELHYVRALRTF
jgi:hypothetical protein